MREAEMYTFHRKSSAGGVYIHHPSLTSALYCTSDHHNPGVYAFILGGCSFQDDLSLQTKLTIARRKHEQLGTLN
ncbi:hypothetical protein ACO22_04755 [Paracoccidioides brasiliensis]|uniref:Uncharacterized protein n=1 Tax=Paracoccidioides brasiliensis TaxID=121759 RepID=A0A1D2JCI9_PARBR|nr:hypothetical protein ACO22_04755 [Paracoccidioides brasiliensis]